MHKKQVISAEVATKIRSIAEPIIEWLHNAEEESSSDDEVEVLCKVYCNNKEILHITLGGLF